MEFLFCKWGINTGSLQEIYIYLHIYIYVLVIMENQSNNDGFVEILR